MSIRDEINRLAGNVTASLDAVEARGVSVPEGANSNDLATLIAAIPAGGGGGTQADWNVNDPSDPAHVLNRPFYVSDEMDEVPLVVDDVQDAMDMTPMGMPIGMLSYPVELVPGMTYIVRWNGVEYTSECLDGGDGSAYLGNFGMMGDAPDTGEPYMMICGIGVVGVTCMTLDIATHTVSISVVDFKVVQIDKKYLPVGAGKSGIGPNAEVFNDLEGNTASSHYAHAEGYSTTASGESSHAEGNGTTASGNNSHAEGRSTVAEAMDSHAEGYGTTASNFQAHAEGTRTTASGESSHAEGNGTTASGKYSHAEGHNTIAASYAQHVQGCNNIADDAQVYAHIVGNGTAVNKRSNAHTLDWSGNAWYAGTVEGTALILKSPNGTRYKVTVSDAGALSATKL